MIKKILTILLIEDSPEYAELVQRWLAPKEDVEFVLNWTDSLTAGLNRLAKGGVDAILLDLGLPDSRGVGTFNSAKLNALGIPIVVLSGSDTESLALQMVQQGAQDYIIKSTCNRELLRTALQFAVGRASRKAYAENVSGEGMVIGVMGAKGGVGTSTFACNLAIEFRRQTDRQTILLDLDMNAGLTSFLMNTDASYSILDAAANIYRLDELFLSSIVAHGLGGVDMIRSPDLYGVEDPDTAKIEHVVTLIRRFYRWTVLDFGRMTSVSLRMLNKVSELYLVTTMSVPALYEAKRTIAVLLKAGLELGSLRIIVNQVGATGELSGTELGQLFGVPVCARLPSATRELQEACTKRELLGRDNDYRIQIARLARRIAGLPEAPSVGAVAQLRSFANKFRKNGKDVAAATRG